MQVEIYTKDNCTYCTQAKNLLQSRGIDYEEHHINALTKQQLVEELTTRLGVAPRTVPQIFINNQAIGGYTDLVAWFNNQ